VIHTLPLAAQPNRHPSDAVKRSPDILLVDQTHQMTIIVSPTPRVPVIEAGSRQTEQLALPAHGDLFMAEIDQLTALIKRVIQLFFSANPAPP